MCSPLYRFQSKVAAVGLGGAVGGTGTAVAGAGVATGAHALMMGVAARPAPTRADRLRNSRRESLPFILLLLLSWYREHSQPDAPLQQLLVAGPGSS